MLIHSLEIVGNKRLRPRGINRFYAEFTEIVQMFLGTNGSCKTTIYRELNPLPPAKSDYDIGGYKIIKFSHRGSEFTLTSRFDNGPRHTFEKDGVILNDNGTASVQKELIWQYLQLDNDIADVLFDRVVFTNMQPLKRRDWLMKLSNMDFEYAIELYNRLKSKARAMQDVVKHQEKRLADELGRLPTPETLRVLEERCSVLKNELTALMEAKIPGLPERSVIGAKLADTINKSNALAEKIVKAPINHYSGESFSSVEEISELISRRKTERAAVQMALDIHLEEAQRLRNVSDALNNTRANSFEDIKRGKEEALTAISLLQEIDEFGFLADPDMMSEKTDAVHATLMDLLSRVPSNEDGRFTKQNALDLQRQRRETGCRLTEIQADIMRLEHRQEHIKGLHEENCPKCGFIWKPGVEANELTTLSSLCENKKEELLKCREYSVHLDELAEQMAEYWGVIRQYNVIVSGNNDLRLLWDKLTVCLSPGNSPTAAYPILNKWREAIDVSRKRKGLENEVRNADLAIHHLEASAAGDISDVARQLSEIEISVELETSQLQLIDSEVTVLTTLRNQITNILGMASEFKELEGVVAKDFDTILAVVRNETYNELIGERQLALAETEATLSRARNAEAVVAELKRNRDEAIADGEAYTVLLKELSPSDGLIADNLVGFINSFVDTMNQFISQVWSHDFTILPFKLDEGALDYNLPFVLNGNDDIPISDVSEGSRGQRDFIDFVFKFVVMMYLDMNDWPLFIDELVPSLDEQHRHNATMFVKAFVESRRCSQLFMISHYVTLHGAFSNVEFCVMDTSNIVTLPGTYNKHVSFS